MPLRKKLDSRIKTLVDNGRINNHRSFLVIVGDKGKDQVRTVAKDTGFLVGSVFFEWNWLDTVFWWA